MRLGSDGKSLNCRAGSVFRSVNICADTGRATSESFVRPRKSDVWSDHGSIRNSFARAVRVLQGVELV
jgi:hypothetical protein